MQAAAQVGPVDEALFTMGVVVGLAGLGCFPGLASLRCSFLWFTVIACIYGILGGCISMSVSPRRSASCLHSAPLCPKIRRQSVKSSRKTDCLNTAKADEMDAGRRVRGDPPLHRSESSRVLSARACQMLP